jgi:hypothetical protein
MRTLAEIAIKPLKKRRRVDPSRQREIFPTDVVVPAGISEIRSLTDYRAWNL